MGLAAKLNFAFIAVILVMVLGHAGYALFMEWQGGRSDGEKRINAALSRLKDKEFSDIFNGDLSMATNLARDPGLMQAFAARNRDDMARAIKAFADRSGLAAFVTVTDGNGKVLYSSDSPAKFGYSIRDACPEADNALLRSSAWTGWACPTPTGTVTLTSLAPVTGGAAVAGLIAVNQPLSSEFLTGLVTKFQYLPDPIKGVDLALLSAQEGKIVAFTSGLAGHDGGFLSRVDQQGLKALPSLDKPFDQAGRLWRAVALGQDKHLVAVLLVTTPLPNIWPRAAFYAGQAGVAAIAAFALAFILATTISGSVMRPVNFLMRRAQDLAQQKQTLPPLDGLEGEWLELGELMDTAVSSMRGTVQSLKSQLAERPAEKEKKFEQAEISTEQLNQLNRQLSEKTRQLAELSKQFNQATQQTILLQQKLDSVLQVSNEGYLMLDQFGNVLSANPVFLNWVGANEGEIAGRLCFDLVKKPGEPRSDANPQVFVRPKGNPGDLINQFYPEGVVYHRYQDKQVDVLAHLHPVVTDDSNIAGWIMVLRDKSLRSEVAQLRQEIVAMLSESIRQPLVSVEPTWEAILANAGSLSPQAGQSLAQLHSHYKQLIGLVDSLLMMHGGIMPPPMTPRQPVILTRLVAECLEEVAQQAREQQLSLDYKTLTGLPNINTDREALKRVLVQFIEKMISITSPGGRVRVESSVKGHEVRIGVSSSGPALPQEEIDDLFAGFIDGKHDEATYSSRLSMYLARDNVERLGGRIWADSEQGRGTMIFFTLPAASS